MSVSRFAACSLLRSFEASQVDTDLPLEASALICFGTRLPRTLARSKGGANEPRDELFLRQPMVPFVDEARSQAQTGGRWHPGADGAARAAWP